ncbi:MAG TPA: GspL/Epsl periplasmic domain-containing protein [Candidatus Deferrimicrobiaceae bacterium]
MKRIGISISRDRLAAFGWEKTLFAGKPLCTCEVACSEPYGTLDDIHGLSKRIREFLGTPSLPPAVLSLPPSEFHVRMLDLPVPDLKSARIIHGAEIEGSLPFEGEEIVSDLLSSASPEAQGGRYIAFVVRRSTVTRFVDLFSEAGFRIESVVTDPVSLLCAASVAQPDPVFNLVSLETEVICLSADDGMIRHTRLYPASIVDTPDLLETEVRSFLGSEEQRLLIAGPLPAGLAGASASRIIPPGEFTNPSVTAWGAALFPFADKIMHGFSLHNPSGIEESADRLGKRLRIAIIASAIAVLSGLVALETARWAAARQVAAVRQQLRAEFSAAVPTAKVVVRETAQIREKIAALQRERNELGLDLPRITPLLGRISAALPANKSLSVKEISVDGARVRVAGEAAGSNVVEVYRTAISSAFGKSYDVTVQESRGSAKGDTVTFAILIEQRKPGRAS